MALQPRVVGQDLARRQPVRRAAQGARLAREHHRREADAIPLQVAPQFRPVFGGDAEMAPVGTSVRTSSAMRRQSTGSPVSKVTTTASGSLPSRPEDPLLQPLLHWTDLVSLSVAQPASGMNAAIPITGP